MSAIILPMLQRRLQNFLRIPFRTMLSNRFCLDDEWAMRFNDLSSLGISGSYEWITAVQKKFISAGVASAVDVDAAVCVANDDDQLEDVMKIVYKLRHSENTGNMLPSTSYALLRLLLKYQKGDKLLTVLNDPINYGVFVNEHSASLIIDHFLKTEQIAGAAKVASIIMQQEMFSSQLLNWLCIYSALKWVELPRDKRNFDGLFAEPSDDVNLLDEEDERVFKFPYLKNDCGSDNHFDMVNANHLVGKSLLWFTDNDLSTDEEALLNSIRLLGSVFFEKLSLAQQLLSNMSTDFSTITTTALAICGSELDYLTKDTTASDSNVNELKALFDKRKSAETTEKLLSNEVLRVIRSIQSAEEEMLMTKQCIEFNAWKNRRAELVHAQAERLNLKLRLGDVIKEQNKLKERWEILNFFGNRLQWEDIARAKDGLLQHEQREAKSKEELEQEYIENMFLKKNHMT